MSTLAAQFDPADLNERCREEILTPAAMELLAELHGRFDARRRELLAARTTRLKELRAGQTLDFLPQTREIREGGWRVPPPRPDYADRRVEITGPTDAKLVINALNSGARGFMADFEDANSPTWSNQIDGQLNLREAVTGTLTYESSDGRHYSLRPEHATLLVRPRGWHLEEKHVTVGGERLSGALTDFGLFAFHCARPLLETERGAYLYLPKLEHHLEARLWEDVLSWTEDALGIARGSFRATVLIETLPAAFQMEEIIFELREHSYGLNAGRWDYIFSMIKTLGDRPEFVLPDRDDVKMTVPFMSAYAELLVQVCHRRGAFAMGGMAALIPSRTDPDANDRAIAAVRDDKEREAGLGFDGTWVAHPDLVEVAAGAFDAVLGDRPNQIDRQRPDLTVSAGDLLDVASTPGAITERCLRNDIAVGFRYISFWLSGRGAAGINNLMEDAATAEICRSQIWQWIHHERTLEDGRTITPALVRQMLDEEMDAIRQEVGEETWAKGRPEETRAVLERVALEPDLPPFLTEIAYALLD
ncbi:MAG TPA: malate synthase A [Solirubrobacteraceae bacterium]|nr:malate synthase A [Solirubrobacteraceae bacterium]